MNNNPDTPNLVFAYFETNALVDSTGMDFLYEPESVDGEQEPAEFLDTLDLPEGFDFDDADDVLAERNMTRMDAWKQAESGEYWFVPVQVVV